MTSYDAEIKQNLPDAGDNAAGTYDSIDRYLDLAAMAATDSSMHAMASDDYAVIRGDVDNGWVIGDAVGSDGLTISYPALVADRVWSPGSRSSVDPMVGGSYTAIADFAPGVGGQLRMDSRTLYDQWRFALSAAFKQFVELPDPRVIRRLAPPIEGAVQLLALQAGQGTAGTHDLPNKSQVPNNQLLGDVESLKGHAENLSGAAFDVFNKKFVLPMSGVMSGFTSLMNALCGAIGGEAQLWLEARQSIANIAHGSIAAMYYARPVGGNDDTEGILGILGAVAVGVATFVSPELWGGVALAVATGAAAGIPLLSGGGEKPQPKKVRLGASTPDGVLTNICSALSDARTDIGNEEDLVSVVANAWVDLTEQSRDSYGVPRHVESYDDPVLNASEPDVDALHRGLPDIADQVRRAGQRIDIEDTPLWRPYGLTADMTGPFPAIDRLQDTTRNLMWTYASALDTAADRVLWAYDELHHVDDGVTGAIGKLANGVKEVDAPNVGTPVSMQTQHNIGRME